jgi:hypothetical protein
MYIFKVPESRHSAPLSHRWCQVSETCSQNSVTAAYITCVFLLGIKLETSPVQIHCLAMRPRNR